MRFALSACGALFLASTVRFITGNAAGWSTLGVVLVFSFAREQNPGVFLCLSLLVWTAVRYASEYSLRILFFVPSISLTVMLYLHQWPAAALALFLADGITLISLAYRAWARKGLLD